ncbi:hypothetical protein CPB84DRAFT_1759996 [Gymnopilus junonius]|uniref:Uncharacterized protein n=1 Tax=Gymnopilus junonius TaxID=109634 RepID=A0A9P5NXQ6_GYMJU|nr:hypothetical protein CPB84DRAFT_1759996 [Gymnopilus junonius]
MPWRMLVRMSMKSESCWRKTCVRKIGFEIHLDHALASKAWTAGLRCWYVLSGTGGSWKKSPHNINCIPPNGAELLLTTRAIYSSLSNSSPSIIEISSMISVLRSHQRLFGRNEFLILLARASFFSFPSPIPAKECTVVPPIFKPAIPVEAVTAIVL